MCKIWCHFLGCVDCFVCMREFDDVTVYNYNLFSLYTLNPISHQTRILRFFSWEVSSMFWRCFLRKRTTKEHVWFTFCTELVQTSIYLKLSIHFQHIRSVQGSYCIRLKFYRHRKIRFYTFYYLLRTKKTVYRAMLM